LLELRRELLADQVLTDRLRRKYAIRNTHGLRLCALLDGETPLEIFRRLLVGSEGTLAFIAEVVIETIPAPRVTSVAWIPVASVDEAIALVPGLVNLGASTAELMIAPALTVAGQAFAGTPSYWKTLDPKAAENSAAAEAVALRLAKHWKIIEPLARMSLRGANVFSRVFGVKSLTALTSVARSIVSPDLMPAVPGPMPRAASGLPKTERKGARAVYFSACINRMFGRDPDRPADPSLAETLIALSRRAGKPLWIPPDVAGLCCSTPCRSKGYHQGHKYMAQAVADALWRWSDGGSLPIVVDAASCTLGLKEDVVTQIEGEREERYKSLKIIDSIAWCRDLLPNLAISRKLQRVAIHPTCSTTQLGLAGALTQIAACLADEVEVPVGTTCCGTAGDRGLLHPELVVSATREVRSALDARPCDAYLSANRTCEMGLRHATGRPYESFIFLLEQLSRPETG